MTHRWIWVAAFALVVGLLVSGALLYLTFTGSKPLETLDVSGLPQLGEADAPHEIVLVSDYACPACRKLHREAMPDLLRDYVESGRARLSVVVFPVKPGSKELAAQVHCAGTELRRDWHGLFEKAYGGDFEGLDQRRIAALLLDAPADHPDVERLMACATRKEVLQRLERARYELLERGVRSVPRLIVDRRMLQDPWSRTELAAAFSNPPRAAERDAAR